ncbi:flavin monoamine oxidase family protein [Leucothrix pacifica]|uniref:Amine oxidase n=1 Tax=Leucothrix pacifica TaxID=1247513 RepID=A0A317C8R2_9GAMM|nr:NAD(P)/FAD-dependent oxidoreductase [Leucothrix pacifica]PWQ94888.1 amine oxidase [Leucothrix pacifica]
MKTQVLIVGGGLSGLHTAYQLSLQGVGFILLEARDRLGGRILSRNWQQEKYSAAKPAFDMGPAWFWPGQQHIERLVHELDLVDSVFYQQESGDAIYENDQGVIQRGIHGISMAGSYRLQGGNAQLIAAMQEKLPIESVILDARVKQLKYQGQAVQGEVSIDGEQQLIECEHVVIATPPRVALSHIDFLPEFAEQRVHVLNNIKTWMAGHAKLLAFYETPFWLEQGYSGDCISQRGPMHEIHDASPKQGGPYALFGFMGVPAANRGDQELLRSAAIQQLTRLFGDAASEPLDVYFKDWAKDDLTATSLDQKMLTAHPSNDIEQVTEASWGHRLIWSGSETAANGTRFNGYLEGALEASHNTLVILNSSNN